MLKLLRVENFALITELELEFINGLNILTGETGAGKSIIIDAVSSVLGGRSSPEQIRTGCEYMRIEAVFDVGGAKWLRAKMAELDIDSEEDGTLILSRKMTRAGKNICAINGRPAPLSLLRELGEHLLDIHGQHEHQSLLNPEKHIDLLDMFGGEALLEQRQQVTRLYGQFRQQERELAALMTDERERARRQDLLSFQLQEIDAAKLIPGEEEQLEAERLVLANAEKLLGSATRAYQILYEGGESGAIVEYLGEVLRELREINKVDAKLAATLESVESASYQLTDAARDLSRYRDSIEFNPARLAEVSERLDLLARMKKKYGDTIQAVLKYREEIARELDRITNNEEAVRRLTAVLAATKSDLDAACRKLSAQRKAIAADLAEVMQDELAELGMKQTVFTVDFRPLEDYTAKGTDRVEFIFSPNLGEPPKPLARIISGGEMSRVMLALKTVLARIDDIPSMIFDEVDSGVGGRAAQAVAEKMAKIAARRQIVCITHLPQIACMADRHFAIRKEVQGERTYTLVDQLDEYQQVAELARMLGGTQMTATTLQHAREMWELAQKQKKNWKN